MLGRLLLLFILLPMAELALLVVIARHTSLLFTIGLLLASGVTGAWLARSQGTRCLSRIREELSKGRMPADSLIDGLMILVAGVMLLTPGVLTDILDFCLLIPPLRAIIKRVVVVRFKHRIVVKGFASSPRSGTSSDDVIDVEHRSSDGPGRG